MEYIKSEDFRNAVEDSIYRTERLYKMLEKEIRSHRGLWKERFEYYQSIYANISRLKDTTSNIIKGLPIKEALKRIESKQLPVPKGVGEE